MSSDPIMPQPPPYIAETPTPPYVAVIFTSLRRNVDDEDYARTATAMVDAARCHPGYLGFESAREEIGISVSYWTDEASAVAWKQVAEHVTAQQRGRSVWYEAYRVRVAVVHRDDGPSRPAEHRER